jgi:biotin carboxylase
LNVLVLATTTGYQIRSFGEAAAALGFRLVFASDRCDRLDDPWWDQAIPIRFHDSGPALEAIVSATAATGVQGIIAVGDRPTVLAAQVAARLGLPGNLPAAAAASRDKLATRRALEAAGLPVPAYVRLALEAPVTPAATQFRYPVVVKPLALSGSRGVIRANDEDELVAAVERIRALLGSSELQAERDPLHEYLVVERFIPGQEYAVEGLLTGGVFRALAIFDKPDPLDGPFFEETIYVTPSRAPVATQQQMVSAVAQAAAAIGLRHGPVHAECRVNGECVWVLEVAARPIGGLCSRTLRFSGGPQSGPASLEALLLRHAVGEDVSGYALEREASAVMMVPIPRRGIYRGVDGLDEARAVPGVDEIRITTKEDVLVVPLPEARSYLGFIFARAAAPAAAEQAVRDAHVRLRFRIEKDLPLV